VRGQRVHRLRCDEVELFDRDVWDAAQLVTRTDTCGEVLVHAGIEALSTMHRPFGLMQRLVEDAPDAQRRVFRWSVLDTLARCEPERSCAKCGLFDICRGYAKDGRGFIAIDDALQQRRRVDEETWEAEMLCAQPSRSDSVYPAFRPGTHVRPFVESNRARDGTWIGGIDFGYRAPTVLLWAFHEAAHDVLHVVDELVAREHTTEQIIDAACARGHVRPEWIGADPAGHQRSEHTGVSTITLWRRAGWTVRTRSLQIEPGIQAVRRRLRRADGTVGLLIDPRCTRLIESLATYHYPPDEPESITPVKDGSDHACDALRYMIVNLDRAGWGVAVRKY
jgi:hypothetical protein